MIFSGPLKKNSNNLWVFILFTVCDFSLTPFLFILNLMMLGDKPLPADELEILCWWIIFLNHSVIETSNNLSYTTSLLYNLMIHCIIQYTYKSSKLSVEGYIMHCDILDARTHSYPTKLLRKKLMTHYISHTLMKFRHSMPMGIFHTWIYYTYYTTLTHLFL